MRHLLWLGPLAILVAVAVYWTSIRPELVGTKIASDTAPSSENVNPYASRVVSSIHSSTHRSTTPEVVEPILVLRELEVAPLPMPQLVPDLNVPIGRGGFDFTMPQGVVNAGPGPRPDSSRESRPWMPYAPEDGDLSAQRKLQWARLIVDEAKAMPWVGGAEETSEPPLFEKR